MGEEHYDLSQEPKPESPESEAPAELPRPSDWMFLQPGILDQMHDAVITTDLDGVIQGCNRAATRVFGFSAGELIGTNVAQLYSEEERHIYYERVLPSVLKTGEFQGEVRNHTRSGDYAYVHLSVALLRDGEGRPVGTVGFSIDVTSQKLGELAVQRRDEMASELLERQRESNFLSTLKRSVDRANDVILISEAEPVEGSGPRIVYVNPAFERMTGYPASEVIGKTPRILQGPKTDQETLHRIRKSLQAWEPVRERLLNYRKDGTEFYVELQIVPIADERGWFTHWFAIQRDVTEEYKLRQKLEKSETSLHTLMEGLPQFVWTSDAIGRRDWLSNTFAQFVGADTKDCLGDGWIRFVHPDDRDLALNGLKADRKKGRISVNELRLRRHDGEYIWFLKQAVPQFAPDGTVAYWTGSFTDISDRKQAETELKNAMARAQLGIAVARLSIAEVDYQTNLNHLSAEAAQMFGLGHKAMTVSREAVHQTFHPDDVAELTRKIAECLDPRGPGWFDMDHRIVLPDQETRWLRVRKQVFFEGEGSARHPVRAMLAAFDVTIPKTIEVEIRASEKRFRDLAESVPQFVWVTDSKGRKTYCNQRYLDFTGIPSCDLMDMKWLSCIHPDDRATAAQAWKMAVKTGTPYLQEYRLRRHDGVYMHFIARAIPMKNDDGQIERWLGSSTDVHERKLTEAIQRRAEKLTVAGLMASTLSHEINNPLAALVNLLYLIETTAGVSDNVLALLGVAQNQLERVTEVTRQALLFHRQSSRATALNLSEVIESLLAVHHALDNKAIHIERRFDPNPLLTCFADEIRQALAHILNNAFEAMDKGGTLSIRIRNQVSSVKLNQSGIRITIADTGRGIGPSDLPQVFDAFYSTKGIHGTGLGLWVTRDIVARHNGSLHIRSSQQKPKNPRPRQAANQLPIQVTNPTHSSGTIVQIFLPHS